MCFLGENTLKLRPAPDTKQAAGVGQEQHKAARVNPRKGRLIIRNLSFKALSPEIL
jgi:hypothetical protein